MMWIHSTMSLLRVLITKKNCSGYQTPLKPPKWEWCGDFKSKVRKIKIADPGL